MGHTGLTLRRYRQLYNLLALATLALALYVTHVNLREEVIVWHGGWLLVPVVAWAIAALFFISAARRYDLGEFAGSSDALGADATIGVQPAAVARLSFSWAHRFVRHPWYFAVLVALWFRNLTSGWLIANVCLTIYIVVGLICEESRLQRDHGQVWGRYRSLVPALIPWPGRTLSSAQVRALADGTMERV